MKDAAVRVHEPGEDAAHRIFNHARTHNSWLDKPVEDRCLQEAVAMASMGPTSANCQPMRIVFVRSEDGKERLLKAVSSGNLDKVRTAPVTAILGYDLEFYENLPRLFPHRDARSGFLGKDDHIRVTAFRNATLQAGYFILALRAVGLDCGPLSGFSNEAVDAEFFADGRIRSNFLCNIGYGDSSGLFGRLPRLAFGEVSTYA